MVQGEDLVWLDGETKVEEAPAHHDDELRLWLRLLTCTTLIEAEVRKRLREEFDFTLPRFDLLAQLERAPDGMTLGEISKRMMVSPGNLTALVDRLVQSGHVRRITPMHDRRIQHIVMTAFGHEVFTRMAARHADWIGKLFGDLPAAERTTLIRALGELKTSIRSALSSGSSPGTGR